MFVGKSISTGNGIEPQVMVCGLKKVDEMFVLSIKGRLKNLQGTNSTAL